MNKTLGSFNDDLRDVVVQKEANASKNDLMSKKSTQDQMDQTLTIDAAKELIQSL